MTRPTSLPDYGRWYVTEQNQLALWCNFEHCQRQIAGCHVAASPVEREKQARVILGSAGAGHHNPDSECYGRQSESFGNEYGAFTCG